MAVNSQSSVSVNMCVVVFVAFNIKVSDFIQYREDIILRELSDLILSISSDRSIN